MTDTPRGSVLHRRTSGAAVRQSIDEVVKPLLDARRGIGLGVGVVSGGEHCLTGYGTLGKTRTAPVDGRTVFEIGSVTKVFTAALTAVAAEEGVVRLEDPVGELLPEFSELPATITPLRLATHTSGLPRLPVQFFMRSWIKNPRNPYAAYTHADLKSYLTGYASKHRGEPARGHGFQYSNLGFGLLGYVLARRLNMSYEDAVISRICAPLGMTDTVTTLCDGQRERLAPPRGPWGGPASSWNMPALAGAGALRSTAEDMLKLIAANLEQAPTRLGRALQQCHEMQLQLTPPAREQRGAVGTWFKGRLLGDIRPPCGMALGWYLSRLASDTSSVYWHNGNTGGYRAFLGFIKASGTGVVILSNRGPGMLDLLSRAPSVSEVGFNLLEALHGRVQAAGSPTAERCTAR